MIQPWIFYNRSQSQGGPRYDRDAALTLVRTLTRPVLELFAPAQVDDFEDDFAAWTLSAGALGVSEKSSALTPPAHGLDTTLVAGMFFQVVMEASRLPTGSQERVSFIRKRAKDYLVTQLAGQITCRNFTACSPSSRKRWVCISPGRIGRGANPASGRPGRPASAPASAVAGAGQERGPAPGAGQNRPAHERPAQAHPETLGGTISGRPRAAGFACWTSKPGLR